MTGATRNGSLLPASRTKPGGHLAPAKPMVQQQARRPLSARPTGPQAAAVAVVAVCLWRRAPLAQLSLART